MVVCMVWYACCGGMVWYAWCSVYGVYGVVWIISQCRMSPGYKEGNEEALSGERHHPDHRNCHQNHHQSHQSHQTYHSLSKKHRQGYNVPRLLSLYLELYVFANLATRWCHLHWLQILATML